MLKSINDFNRLKKELRRWDVQTVAEVSGVASSTIYFWLSGKTEMPQERTFNAVKEVLNESKRRRMNDH